MEVQNRTDLGGHLCTRLRWAIDWYHLCDQRCVWPRYKNVPRLFRFRRMDRAGYERTLAGRKGPNRPAESVAAGHYIQRAIRSTRQVGQPREDHEHNAARR